MSIELDLDNDLVSLSSWEPIPTKEVTWNNREVTHLQTPSEPINPPNLNTNYNFQNREVVELCYKGDEVREKREMDSKSEDGWFKRLWKKHKTAIIVTTVVVVVVTVVVVTVVTCGAGTGGSVVGGGAAIAKVASSKDDDKDAPPAKPSQPNNPASSPQNHWPVDQTAGRVDNSYTPHFTPFSPEYYVHVLNDLNKTIAKDNNNPNPYLERGAANFHLGNYDNAISDYRQYAEKAERNRFQEAADHFLAYQKGMAEGLVDSIKDKFLFLGDMVTEYIKSPIGVQNLFYVAGKQGVKVAEAVVTAVKNDQTNQLWKALSPEAYKLVTEWDSLTSLQRLEQSAFTLTKLGGNVIEVLALEELVACKVAGASEFLSFAKEAQIVQDAVFLEAAAGDATKMAELVRKGETIIALGEDVGLTTKEMVELNKVGKLQTTIDDKFARFTPLQRESAEKHRIARINLAPYIKTPMTEERARELIHNQGFDTFPRPKGIPDNYLVMISDKGAGIEYVHPINTHTRIRVMPGQLHSEWQHQQDPYVMLQKHGQIVDKNGNIVSRKSKAAHIPLEEFSYQGD